MQRERGFGKPKRGRLRELLGRKHLSGQGIDRKTLSVCSDTWGFYQSVLLVSSGRKVLTGLKEKRRIYRLTQFKRFLRWVSGMASYGGQMVLSKFGFLCAWTWFYLFCSLFWAGIGWHGLLSSLVSPCSRYCSTSGISSGWSWSGAWSLAPGLSWKLPGLHCVSLPPGGRRRPRAQGGQHLECLPKSCWENTGRGATGVDSTCLFWQSLQGLTQSSYKSQLLGQNQHQSTTTERNLSQTPEYVVYDKIIVL